MKKLIVAVALLAICLSASPVRAQEARSASEPTTVHPIEVARLFGLQYDVPVAYLVATMQCESNLSNSAKGDLRNGKYMANGIAQFWEDTFNKFKAEAGLETLQYYSMIDQINLMAFAFSRGYDSHWTCAKQVLRKV